MWYSSGLAPDLDRFLAKTYGYPASSWQAARDWAISRLIDVAAESDTITYGDLCRDMQRAGMLTLRPTDTALYKMLGQINLLELRAGRPLLAAVVVRKHPDSPGPGPGFFTNARLIGVEVGLAASAEAEFWRHSLADCHTFWQNQLSGRTGVGLFPLDLEGA